MSSLSVAVTALSTRTAVKQNVSVYMRVKKGGRAWREERGATSKGVLSGQSSLRLWLHNRFAHPQGWQHHSCDKRTGGETTYRIHSKNGRPAAWDPNNLLATERVELVEEILKRLLKNGRRLLQPRSRPVGEAAR